MRFTRWAGLACLPLVLIAVAVRALPADGTASSALATQPSGTAPAARGPFAATPPPPLLPSPSASPGDLTTMLRTTPLALVSPSASRGAWAADGGRSTASPLGRVTRAPRPASAVPVPSTAPVALAVLDEPVPVVAQPASIAPTPSPGASTPPAVVVTSPAGPPPADPVIVTPTPTPTPRMRTVWSCPNGGTLVGTTCVTTRPYTFHTETAEYTFHEESTPYTYHRETRYGQPCSYLPNPSAPGGLDIYCTPYPVDVRDGTPAGWQDSGSAWVRQVRDSTPAGWTDTGTRWTREVRDEAPVGFTDDGTGWLRVDAATGREVPA